MQSLYGQRWAENYGSCPDEFWCHALNACTEAELRRAIRTLMTGASKHPPTLPEFLELVKPGTAERSKQRHPEPGTSEWQDKRRGIFADIAQESRERGVEYSDTDRALSAAALATIDNPPGSIGHDEAKHANKLAAAKRMARHVGMTPEQLMAKWDRETQALADDDRRINERRGIA